MKEPEYILEGKREGKKVRGGEGKRGEGGGGGGGGWWFLEPLALFLASPLPEMPTRGSITTWNVTKMLVLACYTSKYD